MPIAFNDGYKFTTSLSTSLSQFNEYTEEWMGSFAQFHNSMVYEGGAHDTKLSIGTYTHTATNDNSVHLTLATDLGFAGEMDDIKYILLAKINKGDFRLGVGDATNMHVEADAVCAYIPKQGFNNAYTGSELDIWIQAEDYATQPALTFQYMIVYHDNTPS
jgi:hypothetical protein